MLVSKAWRLGLNPQESPVISDLSNVLKDILWRLMGNMTPILNTVISTVPSGWGIIQKFSLKGLASRTFDADLRTMTQVAIYERLSKYS